MTGRATSTVGPAKVGDVICFEVAYDGLVRDVVRGGAQLLVVQTNNATYNGTGQPPQQMAMSRLRAVESGRDVLVTATSGISAVVRADGTVAAQAPERVSRTLVSQVQLRDGRTLATRVGAWPEWLLAAAGLGAAAYGGAAPAPGGPEGRGVTAEATRAELPADIDSGAGVLVVVPTYNEALNVEQILTRVRRAVPLAAVLVVDDASPDGTGEIADRLAAADPLVHVLHRPAKAGLGAAYLAGFGWGLQRDFDVLVEMDADGSHQPEQLPQLLAALADADLVLGSRWVPGGSVVNWPVHRRLLSRGGNSYVRTRTRPRRSGTPPAASARSAAAPWRASTSTTSPARATASRST